MTTERPNARKPRVRPAAAPTTPDPIEIAMEAEAHDRSRDSPARGVLIDQRRLIRWQIANERMGFVLRCGLGLAALAATALLLTSAWRASRADGLVVEPFSVPAELAQRGLTGPVVASEVLGQLGRLDRETNDDQAISLADSWTGDSHIEIPQTGISLDEIDRLFRRWLGHETRISGAVVLLPEGVSVSASAGAAPAVRAQGSASDITGLAASVAEQIFAQARPVQYGRLMIFRRQDADAERVLRAVMNTSESASDRALAHFHLGGLRIIQARFPDARVQMREALRLGAPPATLNLGYVERSFGHDEEALRLMRLAASEGARDHRLAPLQREQVLGNLRAKGPTEIGDYGQAERLLAPIATIRVRGAFDTLHHEHIRILTGLHRTGDARREIPGMLETAAFPERAESLRAAMMIHIAVAENDWPELLRTLDSPLPDLSSLHTPSLAPWRALALAHLGRAAEARALAATLPGDCYACLRIRAKVAELAGDAASTDRDFAEATRQGPSLPFADLEWGNALLARGRPVEAIAHAILANRKSPAFADPLELWGEAMLAQSNAQAAAAKFAEAAKLAPRWGRLHLKWGEALAKLGKADEARAEWRAAATMDLSAADRAALKALLEKRR